MKPEYIALVFALLANAVANILLKEGMKAKSLNPAQPLETLTQIALNPVVITGVVFFGLNLLAYSFVLSKVKLSIAYPLMTSIGFMIVLSYSFFKLGEHISMMHLGGVALILAGVWMVSTQM